MTEHTMPTVSATIEFGERTYSEHPAYAQGWALALQKEHETYSAPKSPFPSEMLDRCVQIVKMANSFHPDRGPARAAFITGYTTCNRIWGNVEESLALIHATGLPLNPESVVSVTQSMFQFNSRDQILRIMREVYGWNEAFVFPPANAQ